VESEDLTPNFLLIEIKSRIFPRFITKNSGVKYRHITTFFPIDKSCYMSILDTAVPGGNVKMLRSFYDAFGSGRSNKFYFEELPLELVLTICSYLPPEQIILLAKTNKTLDNYIKYSKDADTFWNAKTKLHFPEDSAKGGYAEFEENYLKNYDKLYRKLRLLFSMIKEGDIESLEKQKISFSLAQILGSSQDRQRTTDKQNKNLFEQALKKENQTILDYFYALAKDNFSNLTYAYYLILDEVKTSHDIAGTDILWWALHSGQSRNEIIDLISKGSRLHRKYFDDYYLIHICSRFGRVDLLNYFISKHPGVIDYLSYGRHGIHLAAIHNQLEVVKVFLKYRRSLINKRTNDAALTPLMLACLNNSTSVVNFLLEQPDGDITATLAGGFNTLHCAAQEGHIEIVKILLVKHPKLAEHFTPDGMHAIHDAASHGHLNVVEVLLKFDDSLINKVIHNGRSLLMLAYESNHITVVEFLLHHPATILQKDAATTLLKWAVMEGHNEIVDLILNKLYLQKITIATFELTEILTYKDKLLPIIQGKLELLEYLSWVHGPTFFSATLSMEINAAKRLHEIVFLNGDQEKYLTLLHELNVRHIISATLKKIYEKLKPFIENKANGQSLDNQITNTKKEMLTC